MPSIPPQTRTQYLLFGSKHCTRKDTEMSENQVPALEEHTDKLGGQSSYVWTQWHMTSVMMGRWKEAMQNRGSLTQPGQGNTSRVREKGCGKGMVNASRTRVEICTEGSSEWCIEVSGSVVSNSCDPMDCGPPGFSVHRISQARIMEWVTISSSRVSS